MLGPHVGLEGALRRKHLPRSRLRRRAHLRALRIGHQLVQRRRLLRLRGGAQLGLERELLVVVLLRERLLRLLLLLLQKSKSRDALLGRLPEANHALGVRQDPLGVARVRVERAILVEPRAHLRALLPRLFRVLRLSLQEGTRAAANPLLRHHLAQPPRVLVQTRRERRLLILRADGTTPTAETTDGAPSRTRASRSVCVARAGDEPIDGGQPPAGLLLQTPSDGPARLAHLGREGQVRVLQLVLHARGGQGLLLLSQEIVDALVDGLVALRLHGGAGVIVDGGLERVTRNLRLGDLPLGVLALAILRIPVLVQPIGERQIAVGPRSRGARPVGHPRPATNLGFEGAILRLLALLRVANLLALLPQLRPRRGQTREALLPRSRVQRGLRRARTRDGLRLEGELLLLLHSCAFSDGLLGVATGFARRQVERRGDAGLVHHARALPRRGRGAHRFPPSERGRLGGGDEPAGGVRGMTGGGGRPGRRT